MANQVDTDAKTIGGADYGFGHPAIIRCSNTLWFAGHINQSDELEIHKCTDGVGTNWSLVKTLSNATGCFNLVVISSTEAGLVYQKNSNELEVWITTNSGVDWTNKLDIESLSSSADKGILLYNKNLERLYIVWRNSPTLKHQGKYSDNNGDSWTDWSGWQIYNQTYNYLHDADISPLNNYIYIACDYGSAANNYVYVFDSSGNSTPADINFDVGAYSSYYEKHIAIDSIGNIWHLFIGLAGGVNEELIICKNNNSSPITLYNPLASNIIVKGSSSLTIDEDDNVYVYYTKTSDEKTYYRKYNAGTETWESEVELIGIATNRINTEKHLLAGSNKLHFVYYQQP